MSLSARYDVALEDYNKYLVASLESFDQEKQLLISKLDAVIHDQDALKDLREEVVRQASEVMKLQQALSEHRLMLQEEREKVARLMNENAVLAAQGEDDRDKIASLIRMRKAELAQQTSDEFPLRVSIMRPSGAVAKRGEPHTMSLRSVVTEYSGNNTGKSSSVHVDVKSSPAALDAVLQPPPSSGLVTALSREIEGLKQQLESQRCAYENERAIRVVEERDRHQAQEETLRRYAATIDHLQQLQNETTKELVTFRHNSQIKERKLFGEIESLRSVAEEARSALTRERSAQTAGIQMAIHNADHRHHDLLSSLRAEMMERYREHCRERDDLLHKITSLTEEVAKARDKIAKEERAKRRLKEQHKLENEGLQTEIHLMKQHLRAVEKKIYFTQSRTAPVTSQPS